MATFTAKPDGSAICRPGKFIATVKLEIKMGWLILVLIVLLMLEPLVLIWAINTLFELGIGYNWETWLAAFALSFIILAPSRSK